MAKKRILAVKVSDDLYHRIEEIAKSLNVTVSDVVRGALIMFTQCGVRPPMNESVAEVGGDAEEEARRGRGEDKG